jgi:hypothetical protein
MKHINTLFGQKGEVYVKVCGTFNYHCPLHGYDIGGPDFKCVSLIETYV